MNEYKIEINDFLKNTVAYICNISKINNFRDAIEVIKNCNGKIITVGMGKNGHVARKISSTFCSLKMPSCFLHPGEALHGDSGILSQNDMLLVFSTSGETEEVVKLVQIARNMGIYAIIVITSHKNSKIKSFADITLDIGEIEEAGYLSLAPTTSTTVMMVIGDLMATLTAKEKRVTYLDFNIRHHNGYLAKKSMKKHLDEKDAS